MKKHWHCTFTCLLIHSWRTKSIYDKKNRRNTIIEVYAFWLLEHNAEKPPFPSEQYPCIICAGQCDIDQQLHFITPPDRCPLSYLFLKRYQLLLVKRVTIVLYYPRVRQKAIWKGMDGWWTVHAFKTGTRIKHIKAGPTLGTKRSITRRVQSRLMKQTFLVSSSPNNGF